MQTASQFFILYGMAFWPVCVCILSQHRSHVFNPYAVKNVEREGETTPYRDTLRKQDDRWYENDTRREGVGDDNTASRLLSKKHIVQI